MKVDINNYNVEHLEYRNAINEQKIVLVPRSKIFYNPANHRCRCELEQLACERGIAIEMIYEDVIKYQALIKESLRNSYTNNREWERLKEEIKKKGQTKPLVINKANIVQNGNSRLDIINKYVEENPEKYKDFELVRCVYLPDDFDEDEQEEFEIDCQIANDIIVDYNWYDIARWMNEYIIYKGYSISEVCKKFKMKNEKDVNEYIDAYNEGLQYLQYIGKPNQVSIIYKDMSALNTIAKCRNKIQNPFKERLAIELSYAYLASDNEEKGERLYVRLRKIFKHIDDISEKMLEYKPINDNMKSESSDKDKMNILDIAERYNNEYIDNIEENLLNTFESMVKDNKDNRSKFIKLTNNILDLEELKDLNEKSSHIPEQILKEALNRIVNAYVLTDVKIHNIQNILHCLDEIKEEIDKYEEKIKK